jgi:hypothetical protein
MCDDWIAIFWYSAGPIITVSGRITTSDYVDIVCNQVHPTVQMLFPYSDAVFKMTVGTYTQPEVFCLGRSSMKMHFSIFPGQYNRQI